MVRWLLVGATALVLMGCGAAEEGSTEGPASGSFFGSSISDDEKAIRAGLRDDKGVLPVEVLADKGISDRIQAATRTEPEAVFKVYTELKKEGTCNQPPRSLGEMVNLEGGGRMPVLRDPERVCDFILSEAAKGGYPDANFERGVQDIVSSEELYRKNASYFEPEIEMLLQRAEKHFTLAQRSKTQGIPDAARDALANFQGQQYSRGYGGAAADRHRALFLGMMGIAFISEASKFAAAAEEHCRALQAGAMAAAKAAPNC